MIINATSFVPAAFEKRSFRAAKGNTSLLPAPANKPQLDSRTYCMRPDFNSSVCHFEYLWDERAVRGPGDECVCVCVWGGGGGGEG